MSALGVEFERLSGEILKARVEVAKRKKEAASAEDVKHATNVLVELQGEQALLLDDLVTKQKAGELVKVIESCKGKEHETRGEEGEKDDVEVGKHPKIPGLPEK